MLQHNKCTSVLPVCLAGAGVLVNEIITWMKKKKRETRQFEASKVTEVLECQTAQVAPNVNTLTSVSAEPGWGPGWCPPLRVDTHHTTDSDLSSIDGTCPAHCWYSTSAAAPRGAL
jgi:hypothetical protein